MKRKPLSKEEFQKTGAIYSDKLKDAMAAYESAVFATADPQYMKRFLKRVLDENVESAYADFYYPVLEPEQKNAFADGLSDKEKELLASFEVKSSHIFYSLDEESMEFLFGITARNWLFSTFYYTNKKLTVWGNYNLQFPVFCEDQQTLEYYIALARECGLEIER